MVKTDTRKQILITGLRLFFIVLLPILSSGAIEWPDDPDAVTGFFGESVHGHFRRGLEFPAGGQQISAWDSGEIIWTGDPERIPGQPVTVIEHENGFRSTYRGIELSGTAGPQVRSGEWLGFAGTGEWRFEIADIQRSCLADPLPLLPARNNRPPDTDIELRFLRGRRTITAGEEIRIQPGEWDVVFSFGPPDTGRAAVREVSLFWNGQGVGLLQTDTLSESSSGIVTGNGQEHHRIYTSAGERVIRGISFTEGNGVLELRLRDESGRIVTKSWNIEVSSLTD